jgi:hypothetical protein
MTRKDYQAIAILIKATIAPDSHDFDEAEPTLLERITALAKGMADYMASENERFNRVKFLKACGIAE